MARSDRIEFYEANQPYYEFTNFYLAPFELDGHMWPTSEHYFQAQKFTDPDLQALVRSQRTPLGAFQLVRYPQYASRVRADWMQVRDDAMYRAVRAKFMQNPRLRDLLLGTRDLPIFEHTNQDRYWGDGGNGTGVNMLGQILMRVREELRVASSRVAPAMTALPDSGVGSFGGSHSGDASPPPPPPRSIAPIPPTRLAGTETEGLREMHAFRDMMRELIQKPRLDVPPGEEQEAELFRYWLQHILVSLDQALAATPGQYAKQLIFFREFLVSLEHELETTESEGLMIPPGDQRRWRESVRILARRAQHDEALELGLTIQQLQTLIRQLRQGNLQLTQTIRQLQERYIAKLERSDQLMNQTLHNSHREFQLILDKMRQTRPPSGLGLA